MSDGLPTDEQLRRIERGVQRRIDRRRQVARQVTGGVVAVLLVGGGFALLRPVLGSGASLSSGSVGAAGSAEKPAAASAPASASGSTSSDRPVTCHGRTTTTVHVDPAGLPAAAITACATAQRKAAAQTGADQGATSAPVTATRLCRAKDGALSVWPGPAAVCAEHGLAPYAG